MGIVTRGVYHEDTLEKTFKFEREISQRLYRYVFEVESPDSITPEIIGSLAYRLTDPHLRKEFWGVGDIGARVTAFIILMTPFREVKIGRNYVALRTTRQEWEHTEEGLVLEARVRRAIDLALVETNAIPFVVKKTPVVEKDLQEKVSRKSPAIDVEDYSRF